MHTARPGVLVGRKGVRVDQLKKSLQEITQKLVEALDKALSDDSTRKRLLELGGVIPDGAARGPQALQKLVESEVARWKHVLKAAGVTAQ